MDETVDGSYQPTKHRKAKGRLGANRQRRKARRARVGRIRERSGWQSEC